MTYQGMRHEMSKRDSGQRGYLYLDAGGKLFFREPVFVGIVS